jgi:DNA-binding response OmpR family regulator
MHNSLLIVDEDTQFAHRLTSRMAGTHVDTVPSLGECVENSYTVALVGLDHSPQQAINSIRALRLSQGSCCPILAYTSGEPGVDVVLAYDAGADDCFSTSAETMVIEAKVRSALARSRRCGGRLQSSMPFEFVDDCLTRFEQRLLRVLGSDCGKVVPIDVIVRKMWGRRFADPKLVYEHISSLRLKLKPAGWTIVNLRKHGYRLEALSSNACKSRRPQSMPADLVNDLSRHRAQIGHRDLGEIGTDARLPFA